MPASWSVGRLLDGLKNLNILDDTFNLGGVQRFYVEATSKLPPGAHQVRMEFAYAGDGLGKGGKASLYVDGAKVGEGTSP
jgi:hypothetical protein